MHTAVRFVISVFAALSLATCVHAKDPGALLGRVVVEGDRGPVQGARVMIHDASSKREVVLVTDSHGRFAHIGLQPGVYRALVQRPGFAEVEVVDIDLRSQDRLRVNIEMTPTEIAPFRRQTIRYRRPAVDTESATLSVRVP